MMRNKTFPILTAMTLLGITACAPAAPPLPPPTVAAAATQAPDTTGNAALLTVKARVVAISQKTRLIRLRGPNGKTVEFTAGPDVANFAQVRVGNIVVLQYYESTAITLRKAGAPPDTVEDAASAAPVGAMPSGAVGQRITVTGLVTGIDMDAHTIQLVERRGGSVRTIHVIDPRRQEQMKAVKVGDTLTMVITRALAISVEKAPAENQT
jgi:hypothetical protein